MAKRANNDKKASDDGQKDNTKSKKEKRNVEASATATSSSATAPKRKLSNAKDVEAEYISMKEHKKKIGKKERELKREQKRSAKIRRAYMKLNDATGQSGKSMQSAGQSQRQAGAVIEHMAATARELPSSSGSSSTSESAEGQVVVYWLIRNFCHRRGSTNQA